MKETDHGHAGTGRAISVVGCIVQLDIYHVVEISFVAPIIAAHDLPTISHSHPCMSNFVALATRAYAIVRPSPRVAAATVGGCASGLDDYRHSVSG